MPDDVLGRINAALEDWEHGPDAARWRADGPDELVGDLPAGGEWIAYCAPGRRISAALAIGLSSYSAYDVSDVKESPFLEGSEVVLIRTAGVALSPLPPVTFQPPATPSWAFDHLIGASVNRPMSILPIGV